MRGLLQELTSIRHFLEKREGSREVARDWLRVGSVLDRLLFRIYLLAVLAYSITLVTLWSIWQYSRVGPAQRPATGGVGGDGAC